MRGVLLPLLLAGVAVDAAAQQSPPTAPPAPACRDAEHRQFDFWLGQWTVIGGPKADRIVGRSSITQVANGCAIAEHWVNASGLDGHSLNVYDATRRQWLQFWVGSDGVVLQLAGGLRGRDMVMEGVLPTATGGRQRQRITWAPQPDGSVVQTWETADDAGAAWTISFRGTYHRMGRPLPIPATPSQGTPAPGAAPST